MTLSKVQRLVGKMDAGELVLGMLNMSHSEDGSTTEQFKAFDARRAAGTLIVPSVESKLGIEQAEEILEIPGLRAFGIAMI